MNIEAASPRLPALTSLRFFAAFHVLLFHTQAMGAVFGPIWFQRLSSIGYVGVSFFFVLSGFILVYTYAGKSVSSREFWRARFARVYPAYAFALLLTAPFFLFTVQHYNEIKLPFMSFEVAHVKLASALEILLLQAWVPPAALSWNSVGWSLSVEAFFYLLFPFLLVRYSRLSRRQLFVTMLVCWLVSNLISTGYAVLRPDGIVNPCSNVYTSWMNVVKFFPLARLPEFLMGMAAGFVFLCAQRNERMAVPLIAAGAAAVGIVAALANHIPYAVIHTALLSPAFAAIIYGVGLRSRWMSLFENPLLVLFGDASYSMYLIHSYVVFNVFHNSKGDVRNANFGGLALCVAIALAFSILIYRFIEEPARRKLRPTPKTKPAIAAAAAAGA
jgi:peptidoglycan/LPS O-acetylase OafA/YrhL